MFQTIKDYILSNNSKLLLSSISGGSLVYLPTKGKIKLHSTQTVLSENNSAYLKYYQKVFEMPDIELITKEDQIYQDSNILFDELRAGDEKFFKMLNKAGLSITKRSMFLNNKFLFQRFVKETIGQKHSTNPILIKKGVSIKDVIEIFSKALEKNKKLFVKISDEYVVGIGADKVAVINKISELNDFLSQEFVSSEHENIFLFKDNTLQYDLILESFIPHFYSPSITFYLHEKNIEFLSINLQLLSDASFVGSTNLLPKKIEGKKDELVKLSTILAKEAHSIGARGFIGFDAILSEENEFIFVEANYRTTGSTVPKITVGKATNFSEDYDWFYLSSFYYNEKVKNVSEMIQSLEKLGILFYKGKEKKLNCIITFGERKKRCGLCFFWRRNSLSMDTVNIGINKVLLELSSEASFNPET